MSLFLVKLSSRQHGFQKKDWWGRARTEDFASTLRKSRQRRGGCEASLCTGRAEMEGRDRRDRTGGHAAEGKEAVDTFGP
jgi:hypothetical protein